MRNYHIVTADGERDVKASAVNITATGALQLTNEAGELAVCYAPGQWLMIELETRDDKSTEGEAEEPHGHGKKGKK